MSDSPWLIQHLLSVATFLLSLIFVSILLTSRRTPGNTIAWLIVIIAIPYLGIPLYLILGGRKLTLMAARKATLFDRVLFQDTPRDASRIERILLSSGARPKAPNFELELLETGERAYECLVRMIDAARECIHLTTFIVGNDEVGRDILARLATKARAGVRVRMIVDAVGSAWMNHPSFREIKRAGGEVAYFMPVLHFPFRGHANLRNHRKLVIADHKEVLIGGMNLARSYLGPTPDPRRWVDLSIRIRGHSARDLEEIFLSDWKFAAKKELPASPEPPRPEPAASPNLTQVVPSGPDMPTDPLYDALLSAFFEADERIWIATPYFVPDESLSRGLELAAKRGVDVRILLPRKSNHFFADLGRGSYVRQIESAGARIFLMPNMVHAKATLIDRTCVVIGSANLDMRSLFLNYEAGVFLYSEPIMHQTQAWFEAQFRHAKVGYPSAHYWRSLAEGVGRVLGPVL